METSFGTGVPGQSRLAQGGLDSDFTKKWGQNRVLGHFVSFLESFMQDSERKLLTLSLLFKITLVYLPILILGHGNMYLGH